MRILWSSVVLTVGSDIDRILSHEHDDRHERLVRLGLADLLRRRRLRRVDLGACSARATTRRALAALAQEGSACPRAAGQLGRFREAPAKTAIRRSLEARRGLADSVRCLQTPSDEGTRSHAPKVPVLLGVRRLRVPEA